MDAGAVVRVQPGDFRTSRHIEQAADRCSAAAATDSRRNGLTDLAKNSSAASVSASHTLNGYRQSVGRALPILVECPS
jgi:hypothetical protein